MKQSNLIRNPEFEQEARYWQKFNDNEVLFFQGGIEIIRGVELTDTVNICSDPITVNSEIQYLVSFDVWVEDVLNLSNADYAVILRTFEKPAYSSHDKAVYKWYPSLNKYGIKSGKWLHIEDILTFPDSYARVIVWFKTGHVKIKNLSLLEMSTSTLFSDKDDLISFESPYQLKKPAFLSFGQLKLQDISEEYDLQLTVRIDDSSGFFPEDSFFVVIESDEPFDLNNLKFDDIDAKKLSINFENLTSNKWKHISNTYRFDKKYVIYGALLSGKGKADFKNIKFNKILPPEKMFNEY